MASVSSEQVSSNFVHCGPTMHLDNLPLPTRTVGTMHPSGPEVMYHTDAALVADSTDTHKSGDIMAHTSHTPVIGDIAYSSPCTCFLYGMCPVLPVSEGWERIVGEARGKGDEERWVDEGGQPPDYIYHYPPSGYLPVPHVHTASPHPTPTVAPPTGATPLILVSPSPSSPPPVTIPSTPIPYKLTSQRNEEEPQEGSDTVHNAIASYEETNGLCPSSPPAPPPPPSSPAAPQHIPPNGTYTQPFMEENKLGVYGTDCCWYPLATTQNGSGTEHFSTITSPFKSSVYFPCIHPDPAVLLHPPHDHPTLIPSSHDPVSYNPTTSVTSPTSSSSSSPLSAMPVSPLTSLLDGKNDFGRNGILYYNYFQHLNIPMDVFGKPRLLTSVKKEGKMSLEDLWINHMKVLFKHLPDEWVLAPAQPDRKISSNWFTFRDLAKVRFYCKNCNDGWTSMYGVVVFHYRWNKKSLQGQILYKVAGQKCGGSCSSEVFELPLWYPEEAQKVITNLYYKIAAQFYNLVTPQYIRTRRFGRPAAHHNRNLCEGCVQGVCKMDPAALNVK